jgi:hypothetical protein
VNDNECVWGGDPVGIGNVLRHHWMINNDDVTRAELEAHKNDQLHSQIIFIAHF